MFFVNRFIFFLLNTLQNVFVFLSLCFPLKVFLSLSLSFFHLLSQNLAFTLSLLKLHDSTATDLCASRDGSSNTAQVRLFFDVVINFHPKTEEFLELWEDMLNVYVEFLGQRLES